MNAVRRIPIVIAIACVLGGYVDAQSGTRPSQAFQLPGTSVPAGLPPATCSPAPCVLPPTLASEGGAQVVDAPIAADPLNPKHLLVGSEDFNCGASSFSGFHFSQDGGSTWSLHCMPEISTPERQYVPGGQPMVGYDSNGTAYIGDQYGVSEEGYGLVALQKSSDGVSWSAPRIALGNTSNDSEFSYASLAIDASPQSPYANSLYVSAVAGGVTERKSRVVVSHSSDGGKSWEAVDVAPPQVPPASDQFTSLAVGKDGTAYLTWLYCPGYGGDANCNANRAYMVFSKSADGGNTWSAPSFMTAVTMPFDWMLPNTKVSVDNYPAIAADNSDGPHAGNLYVVMYNWTGTYLRIQVIRSIDDGNAWSKPVPVAPDSADHDQFLPCISVGSTGLVGISWLDRRNDPANVDYQAFATISGDGGLSFQPDAQLTTAFSNPNNNLGGNIGSYTGNTWDGPNYFVAAWMDNSNSQYLQDVVGGIRLK